MTNTLTPEQQRIAELFGTLEVLESLLVRVLAKSAREGSLDDQVLKRQLDTFIKDSQEPQENEWAECGARATQATATRILAMINIGQTFSDAAKRSTVGEA
ncbi:hypothetical protein MACH17_09290 [Phaeobacter inhibens]|uniref:hypothetical protein n=1 Tax=Phaeobacter inhibens TaxID=221822 RepID=UPI0027500FD9|nr:hypothetical protein [Phaeobacter inhibens]GLO69412.1 hypothetical protein MACH17_09290 [Phaeobacter inhibens]